MIADADPCLERIREIALALPGAREKRVVGMPAFYTRRVFAYWGMPFKQDGGIVCDPQSLAVLLPEPERLALLQSGRAQVPMYIGPSGWIGLLLGADSDWTEAAELIEESYRQTAGKRLIAQLEAR
ncbi:MAG: MmcQ/YjbR family DNA-binding protein [Propionibacteriaceae bacterium]|nr:MmcQ/YjbR family DNA-binding protein [Propionibacteriaceae bacterium]